MSDTQMPDISNWVIKIRYVALLHTCGLLCELKIGLSYVYLTCFVFILDNTLEDKKNTKRLCSASSEKVRIQRRLQLQKEKQMDLLL